MKKKIKDFKIGDFVKWTSQAGGTTTTKKGMVVHRLEAKDFGYQSRQWPFSIAKKDFPNHKKMFDGNSIPGNAEVGYFIEVIVSPKSMKRLYMPYPSKLERLKP